MEPEVKSGQKNMTPGPQKQIAISPSIVYGTHDQCKLLLQRILDKISSRFTKTYLPCLDANSDSDYFTFPVEFYERKSKIPVPEHKVVILFKIHKTLMVDKVLFQIENESVSYPLFECFNLSFFESTIDRVLLDKYKTGKIIHLHTNFEASRVLTLNGETKKLFTIEEEENIFNNNRSEYYAYEGIDLDFKTPDVQEIDKLIKAIWKAIVAAELKPMSEIIEGIAKSKKMEQKEDKKKDKEINANDEDVIKAQEERKETVKNLTMTFENFQTFFKYADLDMSETNIKKLWKYTNKDNTDTITYERFLNFAVFLIHCMSAYSIAVYKHVNNNCFENKIKRCVEIMNLHFKEYDTEHNQEITYENLKKCLIKENDLFSRKEIEIILQQIKPGANFQYWKFDKILRILFYDNFNYQKLIQEDKIYKYLINIFQKQDPFKTEKLHYKLMKKAFLTEDKMKFDKIEILLLLNIFGINKNPEIEYYKASLILRNIVDYLLGNEIGMQKIDISTPAYCEYVDYEDEFDKYNTQIKDLFIKYDRDFDHILNKSEMKNFLQWLIPYMDDKIFEEEFNIMDMDKDGVINYKEFKEGFKELMKRTRIKNIIKKIKQIKEDKKPDAQEKQENQENQDQENKENEENQENQEEINDEEKKEEAIPAEA